MMGGAKQLQLVTLALGAAALQLPHTISPARRATRLHVWSNELAVRDYQNLLSGKVEARLDDGPGVVLGVAGDRLPAAWSALAPGKPDLLLDFADPIPETLDAADYPSLEGDARLETFPVYVCATSPAACAALEPLLQRLPESKREDVVFLQRGDMIEPLLKRYGLGRERQTQAVLYLACNEFGTLEEDRTSLGEDVMGLPKFAAESCVTGKWAGAVADRLRRAKFHCDERFHRDWRRSMIECVVFECVYNLVGVLHQSVPVSEVNKYFAKETDDMLYEIQRALRGHLAVTLLTGCEERMAAYAESQFRSKTDNRASAIAADSPFRNAFFYKISTDATSRDFPDPCPTHTEYWEYGLEKGLFQGGA